MGAGNAYLYKHHVILKHSAMVDENDRPEDLDMSEDSDDLMYWLQDEHLRADRLFLVDLIKAFDAWECNKADPNKGSECWLVGETERMYIGYDTSGTDGFTCVYLKPKVWYRGWNEIEYNLNRDAAVGFNRLIRWYDKCLYFWTSGYTTMKYGTNGKSGKLFVKYSRKTEDTEQRA